MRFQEFEERAFRIWERIPWDYREGVDGLVVERRALPHPTLPEVYTLGECSTEAYPSEFGGPDTIRSVVVLYYGSFRALSRLDPEFDWDEELWETMTHELQHHLEALASEDGLVLMDYAADENFKRLNGEPFDPTFYANGIEAAPGVFRVESDFFLEQMREGGAQEDVTFTWHGGRYVVPAPAERADVCYLRIVSGLAEPPPGEVYVVLVRRTGWRDVLRGLFLRESRTVIEVEAHAEYAGPAQTSAVNGDDAERGERRGGSNGGVDDRAADGGVA